MHHPEALEPIVSFLRHIGIGVEFGPGADNGFLPGINIHAGVIHVNPDRLLGSGDLLHEAGHIAVIPKRFRARLGSDLQADSVAAITEETGPGTPADPLLAEPLERGELLAQAWSYAASLRLGLPASCIFFPGSYKCDAYEGTHPMQKWLETGTHHGQNSLARVGMTGYSGVFAFLGNNGLPPFPYMTRWVQD